MVSQWYAGRSFLKTPNFLDPFETELLVDFLLQQKAFHLDFLGDHGAGDGDPKSMVFVPLHADFLKNIRGKNITTGIRSLRDDEGCLKRLLQMQLGGCAGKEILKGKETHGDANFSILAYFPHNNHVPPYH